MDTPINEPLGGLPIQREEPLAEGNPSPAPPESVAKKAEDQKRIDDALVADLVKISNRIVLTMHSHKFPFDFFPDTLNIEESRITVITRNTFFSFEVHSVDIKDISNVFINTTPFFAQLVILSKTYEGNEIKIQNLRQKEAVFARRVLEGLRVFKRNGIDTSTYSIVDLIAKLEELSTTAIVT